MRGRGLTDFWHFRLKCISALKSDTWYAFSLKGCRLYGNPEGYGNNFNFDITHLRGSRTTAIGEGYVRAFFNKGRGEKRHMGVWVDSLLLCYCIMQTQTFNRQEGHAAKVTTIFSRSARYGFHCRPLLSLREGGCDPRFHVSCQTAVQRIHAEICESLYRKMF